MVLHAFTELSGVARSKGGVMKHARSALAALALVAGLNDADAGTTTANLRIQATVVSFCSVVGNTLDFGQVSQGGGGGQRPQTNINVTCTLGLPFQVGINNGTYVSNGQRRMKNDASNDYLSYELYKSLTGTDRFGDAIVSERVNGIGTGTTPVIVPVFGQILSGQSVPTGNYLDNAVITVYF
jgi:spore coat protein U-like protein